jgi:hypothetical protein
VSASCSVAGSAVSLKYVRRVIAGDHSINMVGATNLAYGIGYNLDAFSKHETASVSVAWGTRAGCFWRGRTESQFSGIVGTTTSVTSAGKVSALSTMSPTPQAVGVDFSKGVVTSVGQPPLHLAHGSLNAIAWAVLLPAGVLLARFSKQKLPGRVRAHLSCRGWSARQ